MALKKKHKIRRTPLAEINVVPYIDVMLVLLVIFMITAPLLTQGVHVNLPSATAKVLPPKQESPLIVSVNAQGQLFLNASATPSQPISPQELMSDVSSQLTLAESKHENRPVYVQGDRDANYGEVMKAMVLLQKAGAQGVGLVTQNPSNSDARSQN